MSNYAALIAPLSISGSRLSDGSPNASGKVWFFQPGSSTTVSVYKDAAASAVVTQPVTLTAGGLLNRTDFPDGIFATRPIRLYIESSSATVVSDTIYIPATAGDVGMNNSGWTATTEDEAWTALYTSVGGQDGKYLESAGATARTIKEKFAELGISVKDFGAVGDGIAIDTTAIQAAASRAKSLSCAVIFPDGDYKIDQAIALSSATGVSFLGVGTSASRIITSSSSANILTLSSCSGFRIENLLLSATGTNSGSAISLSSCSNTTMTGVTVNTAGGGTFLIPVVATTQASLSLYGVELTAKAADATARALKLTNCSGVTVIGGSYIGKAGVCMEFAGTTSFVEIFGAGFDNTSGNIGCLWTTGMTGTDFIVAGCPTLRASAGLPTPFDLSALTTNPRFRQWGNNVDGYATTVASGGTFTPDLSRGNYIRVVGTTTGVAYTVALPTPAPSTLMQGYILVLDFHNGAGGAITGWTLNAGYHMSAVSTTDTEHTVYHLWWDTTSSVWRQIARSVST